MESVLTVCDGIGAVHEAWAPLGWTFVLTSEIEAFPREVLRVRQAAVELNEWLRRGDRDATVPLWGDFTALRVRHLHRFGIRIPSVLAGGTPCQAFSVAGLRKSLDDARGNLTLAFVRLANAIDALRRKLGLEPLVIVWENVPGVLSVKDNAFGCFLAGLVGADAALVPPGTGKRPGKWSDAGLVAGPQRTAAWRIVDAQYFGLAQRRRRVFVIASSRKGFDPAAVLFEPEGVQRDTPPRREAGQGTAASLTASSGGVSQKDGIDGRVVGTLAGGGRTDGGFSYDDLPLTVGALTAACGPNGHGGSGLATDKGAEAGHILAFGGNNTSGPIEVTPALLAQPGSGWKGDFESETFIVPGFPETAHTLRAEGFDASEDGTGRGTPPVPVAGFSTSGDGYWREGVGPLRAREQDSHENVVAFDVKNGLAPHGSAEVSDTAFPLKASDHKDVQLVAYPINADALRGEGSAQTPSPDAEGRVRLRDPGLGIGGESDPAGTLNAAGPGAVAITYNLSPGSGSDGAPSAVPADVAAALTGEGEASKNGRGTHVIAFGSKDSGADAEVELSPTLRAGGFDKSHANAGVPPAVAFVQNSRSEVRLIGGDGGIVGALAADAGAQQQNYVAFALRGREDGALPEVHDAGDSVGTLRAAEGGSSRDYVAGFTVSENADGFAWEAQVSATLQARAETPTGNQFHGVRVESSVRRLTPVECERLQGYRDGYTAIPWKGRAPEECPDGPRYKALGNSMAVPCMVWIGRRIEAEENRRLAELAQ